ncbi:MAG: hypothetical protein V7K61_01685 [Nostoc sp.]
MQACKLMRSRSISKFFRYQYPSGIKFSYLFFTWTGEAGEQGSRGAREQGSRGAEEQGRREVVISFIPSAPLLPMPTIY